VSTLAAGPINFARLSPETRKLLVEDLEAYIELEQSRLLAASTWDMSNVLRGRITALTELKAKMEK
jgi:hypothetical protein